MGADVNANAATNRFSSTVNMSIPFVNSLKPASYAKLVTDETSRKRVNFDTLHRDGLSAIATKVGFKPVKQAYRLVSIKPTTNTSRNKKNDVKPTKKNLKSSSTSTTSIVDKNGMFKKVIIDEKVTLVNDEGEPMTKVDYLSDHDSEDEVGLADNDMARFMASKKVGFGSNSWLEL
nr:hypothetical protein [Tanacetum cinerariifolium]